jgi:hypothetical protein
VPAEREDVGRELTGVLRRATAARIGPATVPSSPLSRRAGAGEVAPANGAWRMSNDAGVTRVSSFQPADREQSSLAGRQCAAHWSVARMPSAAVLLRKP